MRLLSFKKLLLLLLINSLAGCVTSEYIKEKSFCEDEGNRIFPYSEFSYVVEESRPVEVPTGKTTCTSTQSPVGFSGDNIINQWERKTECTQEKKIIYEKYSVQRVGDRNSSARIDFIRQCTLNVCIQKYGNSSCDSAVKPKSAVNFDLDGDDLKIKKYFDFKKSRLPEIISQNETLIDISLHNLSLTYIFKLKEWDVKFSNSEGRKSDVNRAMQSMCNFNEHKQFLNRGGEVISRYFDKNNLLYITVNATAKSCSLSADK
jgi:hypothetical protein